MPLIVMVGTPCSGKTTLAKEISQFVQEETKTEVQIINEELLGLNKAEYLVNANQEKILRASLKSNTEKFLNQQSLVILDSMNYIKGFRYELYCLARNAQTTLALVHVECDLETSLQRAKEANYENSFPIDLVEDYSSRMERPNPAQRWDKPCFIVRQNESVPLQDITKAIFEGNNKPRDPVSTKPEELFDANFVFELDRSCSGIISFILKQQGEVGASNAMGLPDCKTRLRLGDKLYAPVELKNLKKDFLNLSKLHPPKNKSLFGDAFIQFLNARQQEQQN